MQNLFGTPVGAYQVPDAERINPVLIRAIRERENSETHLKKSNVGGWHSQSDTLAWPEVKSTGIEKVFRSATLEMVRHAANMKHLTAKFRIGAWANLNRGGAYHFPHNHPGHHWSGVYYAHVGDLGNEDGSDGGFLALHDPRGSINMMAHPGSNPFGSRVRIKPVAGQLVLFPSWLLHSVSPFNTTEERITIAFNVHIDEWHEGVAPAA